MIWTWVAARCRQGCAWGFGSLRLISDNRYYVIIYGIGSQTDPIPYLLSIVSETDPDTLFGSCVDPTRKDNQGARAMVGKIFLISTAAILTSCGTEVGRYREITNNPHPACGDNGKAGSPADPFVFACGVAILDTQT